MKIEAIATAQQVIAQQVKDKTVVVIDVLRATSVMVTALHNGASEVFPVLSADEAFKLKAQYASAVVLGGERHAEPIDGFDYGNSPSSYSADVVMGKALVMTTTNGTLAINNAISAKELLVAAFINDVAIADYLTNREEVVLVCSGNNGLYTLEDALCAGRIIALLKEMNKEVQVCDLALSLEQLYKSSAGQLMKLASQGHHYRVLQSKGYINDLEYCFKSNLTNAIPVWEGQSLKNNSRH